MSTVEAWRVRDPVRFVAHCVSAEAGMNIQATTLQEGVGWIVPLGAMTLFVSLDATNERLAIDVPLARIAERQRVPLLRTALEMCTGPSPCRICLRDDLLLLRRVGRIAALTPEALRQALQNASAAAEHLAATLSAWFDTRPAFLEEQRANLSWASAGRARPLKSFSIPPRPQNPPSVRVPAPPPPVSAVRTPSDSLSTGEPSSAWAAPPLPRLPESVARPIREVDAIPDILSPSFAAPHPPPAASTSAKNGGQPARGGILPPAHEAAATSRPGATPAPDGAHSRAGPALSAAVSSEAPHHADPAAGARSGRAMPFRRSNPNMAAVSPAPVSVRPPPMPELEIDPPSRNSVPSRPDSSNAPAERLCQLLRDAQSLATALSFAERPGTMVLLIRATVFRAIHDFGDTFPGAVAHLYRATAASSRELVQAEGGARRASPLAIAEPALLAMERIVNARCQVPEEKPLHVDPLTTAALAREHLGRFLREIERAPAEPALRHFLAIGALSELLVRTKLPQKTEQRLRDIVAYAQRDGAKAGSIDLLMTALARIVAQ